jgi:hypothetical protein
MMKLSERMMLIAGDKETELEINVAMEVYANEVTRLESQNAALLEALQAVMVMFPDMCADANMCDDPHTLSIINKAQNAIAKEK